MPFCSHRRHRHDIRILNACREMFCSYRISSYFEKKGGPLSERKNIPPQRSVFISSHELNGRNLSCWVRLRFGMVWSQRFFQTATTNILFKNCWKLWFLKYYRFIKWPQILFATHRVFCSPDIREFYNCFSPINRPIKIFIRMIQLWWRCSTRK